MSMHAVSPRPVRRRARGTLLRPRQLPYEVEGASKRKFEQLAERAGYTKAVFFEKCVEHLELTPDGTPSWAPPQDTVRRRARGTLKDPKQLGLVVEEASVVRFEQIARRAGMTGALFFEDMVEHLELTSQGIPSWATPMDRDEEPPIDAV